MTTTTLIKHRGAMRRAPLPACHGGAGALDWTTVLEGADVTGRHLNFIHDDIVPPGATIGVHRHEDDEEYYYVIAGRGTMTLDGETYEIAAGDIAAVFPGGEHGLANTSGEDLHLLVVSVS